MTTPTSDPTPAGETPKVTPEKTLEKGRRVPDTSTYAAYKEEAPPAAARPGEISPMELASKEGVSTTPTIDSLLAQTGNINTFLENLQNLARTPNLTLTKTQEDLLNTKVKNANDHIGKAINKLGGTVPSPTEVPTTASPITRFVGLLTDGQNKMFESHKLINDLKTAEGPLNAGDMLLIQVKLAQAQQEIEYSSVLLSKIVDAFTKIISTQI